MVAEVVLDCLLVAVMVGHLIACPFTKVEESFTMQAMHDFLFLGAEFDKCDRCSDILPYEAKKHQIDITFLCLPVSLKLVPLCRYDHHEFPGVVPRMSFFSLRLL